MNIFTTQNRIGGQALAFLTAISMLLSFVPFSTQVAHAASTSNISASVVAEPTADPEYFEISYSGTANLDLNGWQVKDASSFTYTFGSGVVLTNGETYRVCQNSGSQIGCDANTGSAAAVWNNDGDTFTLVDENSQTILEFTFGNVAKDEVATAATNDLTVLGTTGGDQIDICHATASENNPYTNPSVSVNSFFSAGHDADQEDIIPPFYFDNGNGLQYFAGTNWDAIGQELWNNDCSDQDEQPQVSTVTLCKIGGTGVGVKNFELFLRSGDTVYSGVTKYNGCISLQNIPYGVYILDEVMPENNRWVNIVNEIGKKAGAVERGSRVEVGESSTRFVLQNRQCEEGTFNYGNNKCAEPPAVCEDPDALNYEKEGDCEYPQVDPVCEIGENLLKNGSFEEPAIQGDWAITSIVNWAVTKVTDNAGIDGELWRGLFGGASDGAQNVELDSTEPTKLTQSVVTIPGATYELRFDFSPRKDTNVADNNVDALIDGSVLINAQGDGSNVTGNTWTTHTHTFVASGASTEVSFRDNGTANSVGSLIDNAVMCLVKEPEPTQCENEMPGWADSVVSYEQGLKKGGAAVDVNRSDETAVLGASDWSDGDSDGFFSLGFGGTITVEFDKHVPDTDGDDISIHEATNGSNYPEESALIEVSQTGEAGDWYIVGTASNLDNVATRVSYFDIASTGLPWIKFVRVTDTTTATPHNNDADGFDLDAVDATKELCDKPEEPKFGKIKVFKWVKDGEANFEDFSFQIDNDNPINFNKWGFGWDMKPLGNTYEINETDIPNNYEHLTTVCKVFNYNEYDHDSFKSVELEQLPVEMEQYKEDANFMFTPSNTVTLEDEGDFGVCLIVNKYHKDGDGDPLVCKPGVELIANGGFEEPIVDNDAGWNIFDSGISWLVQWLSPNDDATDPASLELHAGVNGWLPSEGEQYAELDGDYEGPDGSDGEPASTEISQIIETIPGETYTLRWDFSPRPNTVQSENDLLVKINGLEVDNNEGVGGSQTDWTSHSYSFVATGDETKIAFADDGPANSVGTFVDNVSLMCEPETPYGPYCGDGQKNQEWEQCDLGYIGDEEGSSEYGTCNSKCQYENQCSIEQLVRINLDDTDSPSFNNKLYLGNKNNPIPQGVWFKFDEIGDLQANKIADEVDGLAVERDQVDGLQLAFRGGNQRKNLDIVKGTIELVNLKASLVDRYIMGTDYELENAGEGFVDVFDEVTNSLVNFDMRADTGNDGVTMALVVDEEAIAQCNPDEEEYTCSISSSKNEVNKDEVFTITWDTNYDGLVSVTPFGSGLAMNDSTTTSITENTLYTLTVYEDVQDEQDPVIKTSCSVAVTLAGDTTTTGGGGGRKIELGGGGSGTTNESEDAEGPVPQVLGEQVSKVPFGAPNAGAGGTSPISQVTIPTSWLGMVAIASRKRYVR